MRIFRIGLWACTFLLCSVLCTPAYGSLIDNGSFELPLVTGVSLYRAIAANDINYWTLYNPNYGWGVGRNIEYTAFITTSETNTSTYDWANTYHTGSQSVILNGDGLGVVSIAQSFATVAGQIYRVSFYLADESIKTLGSNGSADPPSESAVTAIATGNTTLASATYTHNAAGWILVTFDFTADSGTTTLTLMDATPMLSSTGQNIQGLSPVIDDVSVSAVPEPGTWVLMGSGLLAALAFRRRR